MTATITATLTEFIHDNFVFDDSTIAVDASFLDSGLIDSTGVLEVVLFLEETFGIAVDDDDVLPEHFDSIARLTAYVTGKLGQLGTGAAAVAAAIDDRV
jgi:acyl carrier protein